MELRSAFAGGTSRVSRIAWADPADPPKVVVSWSLRLRGNAFLSRNVINRHDIVSNRIRSREVKSRPF